MSERNARICCKLQNKYICMYVNFSICLFCPLPVLDRHLRSWGLGGKHDRGPPIYRLYTSCHCRVNRLPTTFRLLRCRGYWTVERPRQQPNYHAVRRSCRERGALFEDPDFPAGPKCLYKNKRPAVQPIVWMRPHVSHAVILISFRRERAGKKQEKNRDLGFNRGFFVRHTSGAFQCFQSFFFRIYPRYFRQVVADSAEHDRRSPTFFCSTRLF